MLNPIANMPPQRAQYGRKRAEEKPTEMKNKLKDILEIDSAGSAKVSLRTKKTERA